MWKSYEIRIRLAFGGSILIGIAGSLADAIRETMRHAGAFYVEILR